MPLEVVRGSQPLGAQREVEKVPGDLVEWAENTQHSQEAEKSQDRASRLGGS